MPRPGQPVPVVATLDYGRETSDRLAGAATRDEARQLLRDAHDALWGRLEPSLSDMRERGLISDYASSWRLGEVVVHTTPAQREHVAAELSQVAGLKNIVADPRAGRQRLRHR